MAWPISAARVKEWDLKMPIGERDLGAAAEVCLPQLRNRMQARPTRRTAPHLAWHLSVVFQ